MPLNLESSSGDFTPIIKMNAKAGRWYKRDQVGDQYQDVEVADLTAVFDLENIATGWLAFPQGGAPNWVPDPSLSDAGVQPSPDHKRGFKINLYSDKNLDGLREWMSNSNCANTAVKGLYAAYEGLRVANVGKVPVVRSTGMTPIATQHGTNYQPTLEIVAWADRPEGLTVEAAAPAPPPAAAPANTLAPPPPAPAASATVEF